MGLESSPHWQNWEYHRMYCLRHRSDLWSLCPILSGHQKKVLWLFCHRNTAWDHYFRHNGRVFWYCLRFQRLKWFLRQDKIYYSNLVRWQFVWWISRIVCYLLLSVERDSEDNTAVCHAFKSFSRRAESKLRERILFPFK